MDADCSRVHGSVLVVPFGCSILMGVKGVSIRWEQHMASVW